MVFSPIEMDLEGLTVDAVFGLDDLLEGVVGLSTDLQGLGEGSGASREEHKLLESQLVARVGASVDNVKRGDRKVVRRLDAREFGKVLVQRNTLP